jgi:hypothetical protein
MLQLCHGQLLTVRVPAPGPRLQGWDPVKDSGPGDSKLSSVTASAKQGARELQLSSTSRLKAGQWVRIAQSDPGGGEAMRQLHHQSAGKHTGPASWQGAATHVRASCPEAAAMLSSFIHGRCRAEEHRRPASGHPVPALLATLCRPF